MPGYLFFNAVFATKFSRALEQKSLPYSQQLEPVQGAILITTPEDIEDELWDEIDEIYDDLSDQDQQLMQSRLEDNSKVNTAGIYIQLINDRQTIAQVNPEVMNRMLEKNSMDEFNEFVEAIVNSVEKPDESALCKR